MDISVERLFPLRMTWEPVARIAGHDVGALVKQYGTPLYLYDVQTMDASVTAYRDALAAFYPGRGQIAYAAKAYLTTAVVQWAAARQLELDVVSLWELQLALQAGFPPERMHLHGNNKSDIALQTALTAGIGQIVCDNETELRQLAQFAAEVGRVQPIWLRLTPDVDVPTHAYRRTGHRDSKFGFRWPEAEQALAFLQCTPQLRLTGLHMHLGSQIFRTEPFAEASRRILAWAGAHDVWPEAFSPGGGWGVPYTPNAPEGDLNKLVRAIAAVVQEESARWQKPLPALLLEPGRSLVARAGVAVYRVGNRKVVSGVRVYVAVDGGMGDNLRPALYGATYHACLLDRMGQIITNRPTETVQVVGPYCESGDFLIKKVTLPQAQRGDLLLIPMSGAYHLSMASNYNLRPRPAALWLQEGQVTLVQRRETLADLSRRDEPWPGDLA